MARREDWTLVVVGALITLTAILLFASEPQSMENSNRVVVSGLLSDPFLQYPTESGVRVVWFTEFPGQEHVVVYGQPGSNLANPSPGQLSQAFATTTKLRRTREDERSHLNHPNFQDLDATVRRPIWRHEAEITGLVPGQRYPYQVISLREDGRNITSRVFTLGAAPEPGQPIKILLTSDHQLMPMTPANLQKVQETVGLVDAVFLAGDLVNIPDRASEWFDDARGNAFFPSLQGRADYPLEKGGQTVRYKGGEIVQHAPLFPAIGNHEVMGRYSSTAPLNAQFSDAAPRRAAIANYAAHASIYNPDEDPGLRQQWIINNSFNSDTYEDIFSLPLGPDQHSRYYAITFGDIRLISLYVTQIWRSPTIAPQVRGRYQEREADLGVPQNWGFGQHIFEPIDRASAQFQWLERELTRPEFQQAPFKIVMFHHPPHSLGSNVVPPFTDPVAVYDRWPDGSLKAVRYEYPKEADYLMQDLTPLLESAGVQLVFFGHSHLWNRFVSPQGTHYLETSNVGNTYNAYLERSRKVPQEQLQEQLPNDQTESQFNSYQAENYQATGDPNGLPPQAPNIAPLEEDGQIRPYIASNDITVFSILETNSETGVGTISSYYFDTRQPDSDVVKFDEFQLNG